MCFIYLHASQATLFFAWRKTYSVNICDAPGARTGFHIAPTPSTSSNEKSLESWPVKSIVTNLTDGVNRPLLRWLSDFQMLFCCQTLSPGGKIVAQPTNCISYRPNTFVIGIKTSYADNMFGPIPPLKFSTNGSIFTPTNPAKSTVEKHRYQPVDFVDLILHLWYFWQGIPLRNIKVLSDRPWNWGWK